MNFTREEAEAMKVMYEGGATVEQVALEFERDSSRTRNWLIKVGTEMRSQGMRPGTKMNNLTRTNDDESEGTGIHRVRLNPRQHRRRGRR